MIKEVYGVETIAVKYLTIYQKMEPLGTHITNPNEWGTCLTASSNCPLLSPCRTLWRPILSPALPRLESICIYTIRFHHSRTKNSQLVIAYWNWKQLDSSHINLTGNTTRVLVRRIRDVVPRSLRSTLGWGEAWQRLCVRRRRWQAGALLCAPLVDIEEWARGVVAPGRDLGKVVRRQRWRESGGSGRVKMGGGAREVGPSGRRRGGREGWSWIILLPPIRIKCP